MYAEFLSHQALVRPNAIAVSLRPVDVTYARFQADIVAAAARLRELALPSRSLVGVNIAGNPYQHWVLILALARLGHVSASFATAAEARLLAPAVVISLLPFRAPDDIRCVELDDGWWREAASKSGSQTEPNAAGLADGARVVLSSGTTGTPKKVLLTHETVLRRVRAACFGAILRGQERAHTALRVDTAGGFRGPLQTWWLGGTVVLGRVGPERLIQDRITGLYMSPAQLDALIEQLPGRFSPLRDLQIHLTGSALSQPLATRTRLRLTSDVTVNYASTEAGLVTACPIHFLDGEPTHAGVLLPGVAAQAVDEHGEVLPFGETGLIRVRTPAMVGCYLDDPETTRTAFRDGWFHPGDLGSVSADGSMYITGRVDEVLNIRGIKSTPNAIENAVIGVPGVRDAAAFALTGETGEQSLWLALVADETVGIAAVRRACASLKLAPTNLLRVSAIPRNHMGKIDRAALQKAVAMTKHAREPGEAVN